MRRSIIDYLFPLLFFVGGIIIALLVYAFLPVPTINDYSKSVAAVYWVDGTERSARCTATLVKEEPDKSWFLTAGHCVGPLLSKNSSITISISDDRVHFYNAELARVGAYYLNERPKGADNPEIDLAYLVVYDNIPDMRPMKLGDSQELHRGDEIISMGFPLGDFLKVTELISRGVFSGRLNNDVHKYGGYLALQVFVSPGNSGGPIIDPSTGKIVGVLSAIAEESMSPFFYAPYALAMPIEWHERVVPILF